jgi:tripartite-type tricarboxylate transporter receptor subunit TctC
MRDNPGVIKPMLSREFWSKVVPTLLALSLGLVWPASASEFGEQLAGKTVKLIIAGSPGGSHDAYGRTLARHLQIVLPETDFVIQNNRKAGGLLAAKEVQEAGDRAITLGLFHPSMLYMQLLDQHENAFDLNSFKWIASLSRDQRFYGVRKDFPAPTLDGVRAYDGQVLAGTSASGATSDIDLLLGSALTGMRTKVVYGFRSSAQRKAIIASELDMIVGSLAGGRKLMESGDLIPLLKISPDHYPDAFAGIPSMRDSTLPGAPAELVELMETINDMGRVLAAAPNTGDGDVRALRDAVDLLFSDAGYQKDNAELGLYLSPEPGTAVEARIGALLTGRPTLKASLTKAVECGRQISEARARACNFASW